MLATPTASKWSRHRRHRRELGLCGYHGCEVQTGDEAYYCAEHKPKHQERMKRLRAAKRAARKKAAA